MSTNRKNFHIEDGPNREVLIDAFKYAYDKNIKFPISFTLVNDDSSTEDSGNTAPLRIKKVKITGIDHEKGDGYSFIIRGYVYVRPHRENLYGGSITKSIRHQFTACYDAQTRKGRASIISYNNSI